MTIIKLKSSDNEVFEVEEKVIRISQTIKTMLDDLGICEDDTEPIPIQNVSSNILAKILKWAEQHQDDEPETPESDEDKRAEDIHPWDADFLKVDQSTLFELILAANYLDIKGLLDAACKTVANMIRGKSPDEIRKHFNIKNDFTPEEEEKIRTENEWCEEK